MNLASKLGEDVAGAGEILLTAAAHEALPPGHYRCTPRTCPIGGTEIECLSLRGGPLSSGEVEQD